ncbi:MAG: glycoside hydrolase family 88 protein [Bacteroidota bacterium]
MKQVCKQHWALVKSPGVDAERGLYYTGVLAMYEATQKKKYFKALVGVGFETGWATGPQLSEPATHLIAQTYLDMHRLSGSNSMYFVYQLAIDSLLPHADHIPIPSSLEMFYVLPALAKLQGITQDQQYGDLGQKSWKLAQDQLYFPHKQLWSKSIEQKAAYDAQSSAWVLAALVRVWHELHPDSPSKLPLTQMGVDMAEVYRHYQQTIGLWPKDFANPRGQSHGDPFASTILCYAFAAGINQGLLDQSIYESHVLSAWQAIEAKEEWTASEAGIFLMAGAELLRLFEQ